MRELLTRRFISLSALVVLLASAGFAGACDPGAGVTWVNETDDAILIYLRDDANPDSGSVVAARGTLTEGVIIAVWHDVVVVRDVAGKVLYREEVTWDELKAQDFTFVITEDDISQYSPD